MPFSFFESRSYTSSQRYHYNCSNEQITELKDYQKEKSKEADRGFPSIIDHKILMLLKICLRYRLEEDFAEMFESYLKNTNQSTSKDTLEEFNRGIGKIVTSIESNWKEVSGIEKNRSSRIDNIISLDDALSTQNIINEFNSHGLKSERVIDFMLKLSNIDGFAQLGKVCLNESINQFRGVKGRNRIAFEKISHTYRIVGERQCIYMEKFDIIAKNLPSNFLKKLVFLFISKLLKHEVTIPCQVEMTIFEEVGEVQSILDKIILLDLNKKRITHRSSIADKLGDSLYVCALTIVLEELFQLLKELPLRKISGHQIADDENKLRFTCR